jgi:hypothetical protein
MKLAYDIETGSNEVNDPLCISAKHVILIVVSSKNVVEKYIFQIKLHATECCHSRWLET